MIYMKIYFAIIDRISLCEYLSKMIASLKVAPNEQILHAMSLFGGSKLKFNY